MFGQNVQFERNACDCNCNILPQIKHTFGLSRPLNQQQPHQAFVNRNQHQNEHKHEKHDKISIAQYKKTKDILSLKGQQTQKLVTKSQQPFQGYPIREPYHVYESSQISLPQQRNRVHTILPQPKVYVNQIQSAHTLKREYSGASNFHYQYISTQQKNTPVSSTLRFSSYQYPQNLNKQTIRPTHGRTVQSNTNNFNLNTLKVPPFIKNPDLSTQASNYIMQHKTQQPSLIEQQQERQPSINQNITSKKQIKRQPLTHFRAIQSINGLTDQSLDQISEVISHGFQRDQFSNRHLSWGTQNTNLILQKIRSQTNNSKSLDKKRSSGQQIISSKF